MATICWKMGHFDGTAAFYGESEKTVYRQMGRWPKTEVSGHAYEQTKKPFKINNTCASIRQGFWPGSQVAHFPTNRCHPSGSHIAPSS
jgi:hypothetical protein